MLGATVRGAHFADTLSVFACMPRQHGLCPRLAWAMPDREAKTTMRTLDLGSGNTKSCVHAARSEVPAAWAAILAASLVSSVRCVSSVAAAEFLSCGEHTNMQKHHKQNVYCV